MHGEVGRGFRYRAYVMAPLDALEFNAEEGIREGRQKGSEANVRNVAFTGRAEYVGVPRPDGRRELLERRVELLGAAPRHHGAASARSTRATSAIASSCAAQFAHVVDRRRRPPQRRRSSGLTGVSPNIAKALARLLRRSRVPRLEPGLAARPRRLRALRELRHAVPDARRLSCRSRSSIATRGSPALTYYPDPDIAVKVDYVRLRSQSSIVRDSELLQHRPGLVVLMQTR